MGSIRFLVPLCAAFLYLQLANAQPPPFIAPGEPHPSATGSGSAPQPQILPRPQDNGPGSDAVEAVEPKKPKPFPWIPFIPHFPWGKGKDDAKPSSGGSQAGSGAPGQQPQVDPAQPHILPHPWSPNGNQQPSAPKQPPPRPGNPHPHPHPPPRPAQPGGQAPPPRFPPPPPQNGESSELARAVSNRIAQFLQQAQPVERQFVQQVGCPTV